MQYGNSSDLQQQKLKAKRYLGQTAWDTFDVRLIDILKNKRVWKKILYMFEIKNKERKGSKMFHRPGMAAPVFQLVLMIQPLRYIMYH